MPLLQRLLTVSPVDMVELRQARGSRRELDPLMAGRLGFVAQAAVFWMFEFDEQADGVFSGRQPNPDERDGLYEAIREARARDPAGLGPRRGRARRGAIAEGNWAPADMPTPYRIM